MCKSKRPGANETYNVEELTSPREFCIYVLKNNGILKDKDTLQNGPLVESSIIMSCKICNKLEKSIKMLICDDCEDAYHVSCHKFRAKKLPVGKHWCCKYCLKKKPKARSNKISRMLMDDQPYISRVSIGEDFQAKVPEWCGPVLEAPLFVSQTKNWDCSCCILWDPIHADCAVPQELETKVIVEQLKYLPNHLLIPFTHSRGEPMLQPSPKSNFSTDPQFATPLQQILPNDVHTNFLPILPKNPTKRSGKMARSSSLNLQDRLFFLNSVRKVRIIFESLKISLSPERKAHQCAASLMKTHGLWLNHDQRINGSVPGVSVGDIFFYRMELLVIGLHGRNKSSVDYNRVGSSKSDEYIATSIIVSSMDIGDCDDDNELIYTSPPKGPTSHKLDVLALERSMFNGVEVRVIRDIRCDCSPTKKVHVYDGLYKIVQLFMDETAKSRICVYKFRLLRIQGQEESGSSKITRAMKLKVSLPSVRSSGYLNLDISYGKENFAVPLFNDIDELIDPLSFQYATRPLFSIDMYDEVFQKTRQGCRCVASCCGDCYCVTMNDGELPYDEDGILKRGKPVIYECGPWCMCPPNCGNRVSQGGIKKKFEVFRDSLTEWGVRSLDFIRAGSFLFEMNGVVSPNNAEKLNSAEDKRILVYPNEFPSRWREWGDVSGAFPDHKQQHLPSLPLKFVMDVSTRRGVATYLSHCGVSPNVFVQFVLHDHHNLAYPHLMVFASENIPPLRELSFDYGR